MVIVSYDTKSRQTRHKSTSEILFSSLKIPGHHYTEIIDSHIPTYSKSHSAWWFMFKKPPSLIGQNNLLQGSIPMISEFLRRFWYCRIQIGWTPQMFEVSCKSCNSEVQWCWTVYIIPVMACLGWKICKQSRSEQNFRVVLTF